VAVTNRLCAACKGSLDPRHLWLDHDGMLCTDCAQNRRIEYARRNQIEQRGREDRMAEEHSLIHDHVEGRMGEGR
jgi:recombinational DNA repair protein (RecF pathway)